MRQQYTPVFRDRKTGFQLDCRAAAVDGAPPDFAPVRAAMHALEAGAVANQDEGRQVGHYWLRAPGLAPTAEVRADIERVHRTLDGVVPVWGQVLVVGIGGSALGPQLVADCLGSSDSRGLHFLDNTDSDGIARVLSRLDPNDCGVVVISKSGGTAETQNGLMAVEAWYAENDVAFPAHAVAVTGLDSALDRRAAEAGWAHRFPMWDWVGGRTSVTGPVGLVPMALVGLDWKGLLAGARHMDALNRAGENTPADVLAPAEMLAQTWFVQGNGRGDRSLVVLPYKDRFVLLSRYLQQLVMESLGKRFDRSGAEVKQGLTVFGNKGSTDQHAFMQQVRDGRDDNLVHFIETFEQPPVATSDGRIVSDTLVGLMLGTQAALTEVGRPHLTVSVPDASAHSLGMLIALFERAVGVYAELIDVNAYHQPGVEAGKREAALALSLLSSLEGQLSEQGQTSAALARQVGAPAAQVWRLLRHLAATGRAGFVDGDSPESDRFTAPPSL